MTRGIALTIDAMLAQFVFLIGTAMAALVAKLEAGPSDLARSFAGRGRLGHRPRSARFRRVLGRFGPDARNHLLSLRVQGPDGRKPGVLRSLVRLVGLWLAIAFAFLGFLPVFVDDRRRALQDYLSGTEVVYDERATVATSRVASSAALNES